MKHRSCSTRTEESLRAASTEGACEISTLPLLEENHQDEKETDDDVKDN